jgi:hypothetical protein
MEDKHIILLQSTKFKPSMKNIEKNVPKKMINVPVESARLVFVDISLGSDDWVLFCSKKVEIFSFEHVSIFI